MPAHESCALDVADSGGHETLERLAPILNVTRARVGQLLASAMRKVMRATGREWATGFAEAET